MVIRSLSVYNWPFGVQVQAVIQLSCKASRWPFRFQKQSGIQSLSTSLTQWWHLGSSLIDGVFEKEH